MFLHPARHRQECRRGKHECLRHIWAFVARAPLPAVSQLVSRLAGSTAYAQRAKSKRRWHEILRRVGNAGVSRISGAFDLRGSAERCLASLEDSRQNVPTRGASRASSGVARCLELAKRAPKAPRHSSFAPAQRRLVSALRRRFLEGSQWSGSCVHWYNRTFMRKKITV